MSTAPPNRHARLPEPCLIIIWSQAQEGEGERVGGGGALAGGGEMGGGREEGRWEGEAWVERLRFFFAPPARPTRSPAHTRPMTGVYAIGPPPTARRGVAGAGRPFFLKSVCLLIFFGEGVPGGCRTAEIARGAHKATLRGGNLDSFQTASTHIS